MCRPVDGASLELVLWVGFHGLNLMDCEVMGVARNVRCIVALEAAKFGSFFFSSK